MEENQTDLVVSITRDRFTPHNRPALRPLRSKDFDQATLEAAKDLLALFEMRFGRQSILSEEMDVIATAQKLIDRKLVAFRRASIRSV
jgi:hypothetical protein